MQSYYYCIVIKLDKSTLRNKLLKQLNVSKVCVCVPVTTMSCAKARADCCNKNNREEISKFQLHNARTHNKITMKLS